MFNLSPTYSNAPFSEFLPDCRRGMNQTMVYVQTVKSREIWNAESALRYLRNKYPEGVVFKKVSLPGNTVILRAADFPAIKVGRSVPSVNPLSDIDEIFYVLRSQGVKGRLIQ